MALGPVARHGSRRKVHLAVEGSTLEVRAVEITGSGVADAPVLPDLLGQTPAGEEIVTVSFSVTADGACDTRGCRDAFASRDADAVHPTPAQAQAREEGWPKRG